MKVKACYCTSKGHGFVGVSDGQTFPWAKTITGAKRIMSGWLNSGLSSDQVESAIGCGWSLSFAKKHCTIIRDISETKP